MPTGVPGLDEILGGGLPYAQTCIVHGEPGSGKTTLGLMYAAEGVRAGERVLYVTTCETPADIGGVAHVHGIDLEGIDLRHLDSATVLADENGQSLFHVSEIAFPRTLESLTALIENARPQRLVLDSLTELHLLAPEERAFRRELQTLTQDLARADCTSLLFDDSADASSIVAGVMHGIVALDQEARRYGPDRRRLRVRKMRAADFRSGYHDFRIRTGGLEVYPRLVAGTSTRQSESDMMSEHLSSGVTALDAMFGGKGITRGTSTLLQGSTGGGKSTVASGFALAAAERGESVTVCLFDESRATMMQRMSAIGMSLDEHVDSGRIRIVEIDPAELTPGQFSRMIEDDVVNRSMTLLVIDSLNGYFHAMPDERLLIGHLHELLTYLRWHRIATLLVLAEHDIPGMVGIARLEDLSYMSDTVLVFRHFEYASEVRKCLAVAKQRSGSHERSIRELEIGPDGIRVGEPLRSFSGLLTGRPTYLGEDAPVPPRADDQ